MKIIIKLEQKLQKKPNQVLLSLVSILLSSVESVVLMYGYYHSVRIEIAKRIKNVCSVPRLTIWMGVLPSTPTLDVRQNYCKDRIPTFLILLSNPIKQTRKYFEIWNQKSFVEVTHYAVKFLPYYFQTTFTGG